MDPPPSKMPPERLHWEWPPEKLPPPIWQVITTGDQIDKIIAENPEKTPVLYFISPKCPHYHLIKGCIHRLAFLYLDQMIFCYIDSKNTGDEVMAELAKKWNVLLEPIDLLPTALFIYHGMIIGRSVGQQERVAFEDFMSKMMPNGWFD